MNIFSATQIGQLSCVMKESMQWKMFTTRYPLDISTTVSPYLSILSINKMENENHWSRTWLSDYILKHSLLSAVLSPGEA